MKYVSLKMGFCFGKPWVLAWWSCSVLFLVRIKISIVGRGIHRVLWSVCISMRNSHVSDNSCMTPGATFILINLLLLFFLWMETEAVVPGFGEGKTVPMLGDYVAAQPNAHILLDLHPWGLWKGRTPRWMPSEMLNWLSKPFPWAPWPSYLVSHVRDLSVDYD